MSDFVIVIDEQEKHPYIFNESIQTKRMSLKTADYSIFGFEEKICIERKSLDDFVKSVTAEHDRFIREINRMKDFDVACIVVEGSLPEITKHLYDGYSTPDNIIGNAISIVIDHGIPIFFCNDRQHALYVTEKILRMYYEHKIAPKGAILKKEKKTKTTKKRSTKKAKDDLL